MKFTNLHDCVTHSQYCRVALYSAFIMEGLRDEDYDAVLRSWDKGCIELISEITAYVPLLKRLVNAAVSARDDSVSFPGVFEYEVCSPFGQWVAERVLAVGEMPERRECVEWLSNAVIEFFSQAEGKTHVSAINDAVVAAMIQIYS